MEDFNQDNVTSIHLCKPEQNLTREQDRNQCEWTNVVQDGQVHTPCS